MPMEQQNSRAADQDAFFAPTFEHNTVFFFFFNKQEIPCCLKKNTPFHSHRSTNRYD